MRILTAVLTCLLVLSFPVFVVTSVMRWAATSVEQWDAGHNRLDVPESLGLAPETVHLISLGVIDYLAGPADDLSQALRQRGADPQFFSERDTLHMADVKGLITLLFTAHWISMSVFLVSLALLAWTFRKRMLVALARRLLAAGIFTVVVFVLVAIAALIDFEGLFLQFHLVAFSNDLWLLDPAIDKLIVMFPPGFFDEMFLISCVSALGIAVMVGACAFAILRLVAMKRRVDSSVAPGQASAWG